MLLLQTLPWAVFHTMVLVLGLKLFGPRSYALTAGFGKAIKMSSTIYTCDSKPKINVNQSQTVGALCFSDYNDFPCLFSLLLPCSIDSLISPLQIFPEGVLYLAGGVASGFKTVETPKHKTRLLHVHGVHRVRIAEVPVSVSSLNSSDCFVLDDGTILYQWNGKSATLAERSKALNVSIALKSDQGGTPQVGPFFGLVATIYFLFDRCVFSVLELRLYILFLSLLFCY